MKESYWGYWLVMLGIMVVGVMLLINSTTTGTTHDYYELKETASASMVDAVDYSYYRLYSDIRIDKQKFIENFLRRFSESASMTKKYAIGFYDIHEVPPKVSIKISSSSNTVNIANQANKFDLVNKIDMILVTGTKGESTGARTGLCPTILWCSCCRRLCRRHSTRWRRRSIRDCCWFCCCSTSLKAVGGMEASSAVVCPWCSASRSSRWAAI